MLLLSWKVSAFQDHGWQLGEKGEWGKHANYELAVHVPLMIRGKIAILFSIRLAVRLANPKSITVAVPWKPASAGKHTQSLTELLDLYRTLTSLAGLPADDIESNVDGVDVSIPACAGRRPHLLAALPQRLLCRVQVSPLLDDPSQTLKTAAYSQYSRCPGKREFPALPGPVGSPAKGGWNWPGGQRDSQGHIEGWCKRRLLFFQFPGLPPCRLANRQGSCGQT